MNRRALLARLGAALAALALPWRSQEAGGLERLADDTIPPQYAIQHDEDFYEFGGPMGSGWR